MFKKEIYQKRREELKKLVGHGVILILGNSNVGMNYPDNPYRFRQDSSFLYFFGLDYPNYVGLIDVDNSKEYIFANDYSDEDALWMGRQPLVKDLAFAVGVEKSVALNDLNTFVKTFNKEEIHFFPPYRDSNKILLSKLLNLSIDEVQNVVSSRLIEASVRLRSIKSEEEIVELEKASAIGYMMHT
ncbi:MAG: Xaa-Pro aminopeptidase (EC [uncultured Sulfurovum sp.]|uniref:Xaa-Pro aminopeptidase n=1 Tax=uncultured Sulfurovum sp. TaxID=269237 RepID=A0A6S6U0M4_9BACT|nr:MAG: Xaa-Pro aminopeptidase (EC [uncultured Sulfurovum sp.]